jgi:hypothetical protein
MVSEYNNQFDWRAQAQGDIHAIADPTNGFAGFMFPKFLGPDRLQLVKFILRVDEVFFLASSHLRPWTDCEMNFLGPIIRTPKRDVPTSSVETNRNRIVLSRNLCRVHRRMAPRFT